MAALVVLLVVWALLSIAAALGWLRVEDRRRAPLRMALGVMFVFTGITHFTGMAQDYLSRFQAEAAANLSPGRVPELIGAPLGQRRFAFLFALLVGQFHRPVDCPPVAVCCVPFAWRPPGAPLPIRAGHVSTR